MLFIYQNPPANIDCSTENRNVSKNREKGNLSKKKSNCRSKIKPFIKNLNIKNFCSKSKKCDCWYMCRRYKNQNSDFWGTFFYF